MDERGASEAEGRRGPPSSAEIASLPWVFSQVAPLTTSDFIREAQRRGLALDDSILRELWRHRLLVPFVRVHSRRVAPPSRTVISLPTECGTRASELRRDLKLGRVTDPDTSDFNRRHKFTPQPGMRPGWWNGLFYSTYQLLALPQLRVNLAKRRLRIRDRRPVSWLPKPDAAQVQQATDLRQLAQTLTALEARYLPVIDPEWIHLRNLYPQEWRDYREGFDPVAMGQELAVTAETAYDRAQRLLIDAHHADPVGTRWSLLMRRAPEASLNQLEGVALLAFDYRTAAEILLRFYEDLVERGVATPLPEVPRMAWHPLQERLSYRQDTLDQNLMDLGISPHPRVILAVEGEAEADHAPRVWRALGYPPAPELVRVLKLGGVTRDLEKVAAVAVAPLVGDRMEGQGAWWLIKPPTRLMVAVDPEGPYFGTLEKIAATRKKILDEIRSVLRAQGVTTAASAELDELVELRTWSESCYEFEHFTDVELAEGIMAVHETIDGLSKSDLTQLLGETRRLRKDIKGVWSRWEYKVSKTKLAEALWPILETKVEQAQKGAPEPAISAVIRSAYGVAQRWRYHPFVLREQDD